MDTPGSVDLDRVRESVLKALRLVGPSEASNERIVTRETQAGEEIVAA